MSDKRLESRSNGVTRVLRDLPNQTGYKFIGIDLEGKEWECRVIKDAVGCHTVERCCDYEPFFFKLYGWRPIE
jgi:hypothetical protein